MIDAQAAALHHVLGMQVRAALHRRHSAAPLLSKRWSKKGNSVEVEKVAELKEANVGAEI